MLLEKAAIISAILVSYFLQTSVDFFRLGIIKPDFLLILTVYFAIYRGEFMGLWVGFFGGLLQDVYLGGVAIPNTEIVQFYLGTHALPKTIMGYIAGKIAKGVNNDTTLIVVIIVFVLSILKGFMTFFLVAIFHAKVSAQSMVTIILPEAVYNAILSIVWFRLLRWALPFLESSNTPRYT